MFEKMAIDRAHFIGFRTSPCSIGTLKLDQFVLRIISIPKFCLNLIHITQQK